MSNKEPMKVKTTWLLPKILVKQLKQYALDNDTTLTAIVIEACNEYLTKRKKKWQWISLDGCNNSISDVYVWLCQICCTIKITAIYR